MWLVAPHCVPELTVANWSFVLLSEFVAAAPCPCCTPVTRSCPSCSILQKANFRPRFSPLVSALMNPMPIISARVPAGVTFFQPFTLRVAVVCPFLDVDFRLPRSMLFRFSSPLFHCCTTTDSLSKAGIPAFIYAFQNLLIMRGFLYLDGLTINLINQTKTIFTAICVYLLLGRRQSRMQCVALLMLFGASVLLALDRGASTGPAGADKAPADYEAWLFGGVVPVFLASILSGLASALSQRSLQVRAFAG